MNQRARKLKSFDVRKKTTHNTRKKRDTTKKKFVAMGKAEEQQCPKVRKMVADVLRIQEYFTDAVSTL